MPTLSKPLSADGPVVDVLVELADYEADGLRQSGKPVPAPVSVRAVLDTASRITCIDVRAIQGLPLVPVGSQAILTASTGTQPFFCDLYDLTLTVVDSPGNPLLALPFGTVTTADADLIPTGTPAVIGCDLPDHCVFVYDGPQQALTLSG